jgi:ABC-type phosphate/phosphonate transport system substrate-binding protein
MTRMILSASPRLSPDMQERIRGGLLNAHESDSGRAMLKSVGIERFEPVAPDSFANQRNVLKSYWGY